MAIAKQRITSKMFKEATGHDPVEDDLERCNCDKAGTIGHSTCGWNYRANKPMFVNQFEDPALIVYNERRTSGSIFDKETQAEQAERYAKSISTDTFTAIVEDY